MNGEDNMNEYFDEHDRFLHYDLFRDILKSVYFYVLDNEVCYWWGNEGSKVTTDFIEWLVFEYTERPTHEERLEVYYDLMASKNDLDWYFKYDDVVVNRKENGDYNE